MGIAEHVIRSIQFTIYGLLAVIGIIGYISLVNTMITSILVRKRIGNFTGYWLIRQTAPANDTPRRNVFHIWYTIISSCMWQRIRLHIGTLYKNTKILMINKYEYPFIPTVLLIVAIFLGQIAITFYEPIYPQTIIS